MPRPTLEQIRAARGGRRRTRDETTGAARRHAADHRRDSPPGDRRRHERLRPRSSRCSAGSAAAASSSTRSTRPSRTASTAAAREAVAEFLEVREGYCVHFASAFALMARTLGHAVPHRRRLSAGRRDHRRRSTAQTGLLGVEPASCTRGPRCSSRASAGSRSSPPSASACRRPSRPPRRSPTTPGMDRTSSPTPSRVRLGPRSAGRPGHPATRAPPGADGSSTTVNPLPVLGVVLAMLAAPRDPRRRPRACAHRQLLGAARQGDAAAAWTVVQDAAIDLAIPVPASESPALARHRLVHEHGAPLEAMDALVSAIERASYCPDGRGSAADGSMADAAAAVRAALLARAALGHDARWRCSPRVRSSSAPGQRLRRRGRAQPSRADGARAVRGHPQQVECPSALRG